MKNEPDEGKYRKSVSFVSLFTQLDCRNERQIDCEYFSLCLCLYPSCCEQNLAGLFFKAKQVNLNKV